MKAISGTFYGVANCLMAVALQAMPTLSGTAAAQDVGVVIQDIDLGITVTGICSHDEALKVHDGWEMLLRGIRGTPSAKATFESCIDGATLVEVSCDDQSDRSNLKDPILNDDGVWTVECVNFPPGKDADGNTVQTVGRGAVGISGTSMEIHQPFVAAESVTTIAGTMAHELMHNRGFEHDAHPFDSDLYPLTAPEQVEACVTSAFGGGGSNSPPANFVDSAICCNLGSSSCDASGNCFTSKEACYETCVPIVDSLGGVWPDLVYECGVVPHDSAGNQLQWGSFDAQMCPVWQAARKTSEIDCRWEKNPVGDPGTALPPVEPPVTW